MNLQQVYWLPTLANRLEQAQTLIDFLYDIDSQGHFNTNVPPPWQADSAAAPTGASSLSGNETAYWDYCASRHVVRRLPLLLPASQHHHRRLCTLSQARTRATPIPARPASRATCYGRCSWLIHTAATRVV